MTAAEVLALLSKAQGVIEDPYLPELVCLTTQLRAVEARKPLPVCQPTIPRAGGIGLRKAVPLVKAYVYAEQHPWVKPVAVAAALGIPFLLGYLVGRRR